MLSQGKPPKIIRCRSIDEPSNRDATLVHVKENSITETRSCTMKNTEQALAQQLIAACEALLKNTSRKDAELVRGTLDLAKAHYGTAGVSK
jgi:hypothetical protein